MMNCFEARQDFVGFWRRTLDDERRRALLAHLKECVKCDRAFRAFALTAPMLHSGSGTVAAEGGAGATRHVVPQDGSHTASDNAPRNSHSAPIDLNGVRRADARRAAEILRRASISSLAGQRSLPQWRDAAAGLSAVAAAVLLAYFSVAAPAQSFDDAMVSPDSISATIAQPDTDFFGQQIPAIPAVSGDLAG
jgi:hypothetical protein